MLAHNPNLTRRELFQAIDVACKKTPETERESEIVHLLREALQLFKEPLVIPISNGGKLTVRPFSDAAEGVMMKYDGPGRLTVDMLHDGWEWRLAPLGEAVK